MTQPSRNDDSDLRALLDSIGMRSTIDLPTDSPAHRTRAERDLQRLLDGSRHSDGPRPVTRRRRRWTALAGGVLAVVCALVLVPLLTPRHSQESPSVMPAVLHFTAPRHRFTRDLTSRGAQTATVLDHLAAQAERQPALDPALPVQEVQAYVWTGSGSVVARTTYTLGDHETEEVSPNAIVLTATGRIRDNNAFVGAPPRTGITHQGLDRPGDYPAALSRQAVALSRTLVRGHGCTMAACALDELAYLYTNYVIAPSIAADLWHAVALVPGITDLGTTHDRLGRAALGLSASTGTPGEQLIVLADPGTGTALGTETIRTEASAPRVLAFTVLSAALRVRNLPDAQ